MADRGRAPPVPKGKRRKKKKAAPPPPAAAAAARPPVPKRRASIAPGGLDPAQHAALAAGDTGGAAPPPVPRRRASIAPGGLDPAQLAALAAGGAGGASGAAPPPVPRRRASVAPGGLDPAQLAALAAIGTGSAGGDDSSLRAELAAMKPSARIRRATASGATQEEAEDAGDADEPVEAFVQLIRTYVKKADDAAAQADELERIKSQMMQLQAELNKSKRKQRSDRAAAQRAVQEAERKATEKQKAEQQLKASLEQQLKEEQQREKELADALEEERQARAKAEAAVTEAMESRGQSGAATEAAMAEISALTADLRKEKEREEQLEKELEAEREKERQLEVALAEERRLHAEADKALATKVEEFEQEAARSRTLIEQLKKEAADAAEEAKSGPPPEAIPPRRAGEFRPGDIVDVDTDDGMEYGATVLGLSEGGDKSEMRVRFADGVVDDWPKADFRNVRTEEEERQAKMAELEAKAAALEQKAAESKAAAASALIEELEEESSSEEESDDDEAQDDVPVIRDFSGWLQQRPSQPPKKLATGKKAAKEKEQNKRWVEVKVTGQSEPTMLIAADKQAEPTTVPLPAGSKLFFSQSAVGGVLVRTDPGGGGDAKGSYFICPFAEGHDKLLAFSAFVEALLDAGVQIAGGGAFGSIPTDLDPKLTYRHSKGKALPLVTRAPIESEAAILGPEECTGEGTQLRLGARVKMVGSLAQKQCPEIKPGMRLTVAAGKAIGALPLELVGLRIDALLARGRPFNVCVSE
jgi:hypothetical protein